ncbi:ATP-binding protein [Candidatus Soleaferrea massiliensis]|uniref:ATP-binding protein n=1 Tax=Candidatus Soleaferrea massiliensis TaxID=1470354 RepID=UPI000693ECC3|nr:ATP-binding protein [Candidatus Soleaferrea massiliensis]
MRKRKLKIGIVFLLYALLVTIAFLGCIVLFQHQLQESDPYSSSGSEAYYTLDQATQNQLQHQGYGIIGPGQVVGLDQLSQAYYAQMIGRLVPLTIFFCLFLLITSVAFWFLLKRIQAKSTRQIAGKLHTLVQEDKPWNLSDDLEPAYETLRKRLDVPFEDYKRLNSYLSHEQKNTIARMRTRMELDENRSYLAELDNLTAGIDDILTLSDSGADAAGDVDVTAVCAAVCDAYRKVSDVLSFDFDDRDETIIAGKERWIIRAVSNLVDNAVKYGEGKPVEVRVKCIHGSVVVTVKDHGPGISGKDQKKIFQHRYRVNGLNRDGYGIGLSLVAHVCDLCGGFVTVDSIPGEGSTFYLSFPQKKVSPAGPAETFRKHTVCYTDACKPDNRSSLKEAEVPNHMYVLTNALKNIWRNKGRNILLFCIILLMILSTVVSIVINTATGSVIDAYKAKFGAEVSLIRSNKKIEDQNISLGSLKVPSLEDYQAYGKSELLKSKEFAANAFVIMQELKTLDQGKSDGAGLVQEEGGEGQQDGGADNFFTRPIASLIGFSNPEINSEFQNGLRKVAEGKPFEKKGECLISQKFAKLNNLKVGSKITFTNYSYTGEEPVSQSLTVSGIYEDNTPADNGGMVTSSTNRGNEILTSLDTFTGLPLYEKEKSSGMLDIQAIFVLKNPELAEKFQQELYEKGLPNYYTVSADAERYNKVVGPVEGISRIVTIFLVVVLVLGSLILILLSTMAIRERKYEVGVLRAMGMKKAKVALGMITEMLVITAACLVIGLGIGAAASQPIADTLLQSQVQTSQSQEAPNNNMEISNAIQTSENAITELNIQLSGPAIGQIAWIALLLALLSSAAGVIFITRYEPVKILSERN